MGWKGYPLRIKEDQILFECRLFAILHEYDIMAAPRTEREKVSPKVAVERIKNAAGTQFDPKLVDLFVKVAENGGV